MTWLKLHSVTSSSLITWREERQMVNESGATDFSNTDTNGNLINYAIHAQTDTPAVGQFPDAIHGIAQGGRGVFAWSAPLADASGGVGMHAVSPLVDSPLNNPTVPGPSEPYPNTAILAESGTGVGVYAVAGGASIAATGLPNAAIFGSGGSDGGVYGLGDLEKPGVVGQAGGVFGNGVEGYGTGTLSGVAGFADPGGSSTGVNGTGVYGQGSGPGGPGVRGIGSGGPDTWPPGTAGVSGQGKPENSGAAGVYGQGGPQNPGVVGQAGSGAAYGVLGWGAGSFSGVAGYGDPESDGAGVTGVGRGPSAPGVTGIGIAPSGIGGNFQGGENAPPLPVNIPGPVGVFASAALPPGGNAAGEGIAVVATSTGGTAVLALSTTDPVTGNSAPALVATAGTSGGPAASFTGDVTVKGTLTATTKHFVIDHPLDPANRYLAHASVESWEHVNVYSGNVLLDDQGEAAVNLPPWVQALCEDFRYQLTCVGRPAPVYVADEVADSQFRIAGGRAGTKVSWQLTGVRKDAWAKAHPLVVERDKPGE
jgi:hypothetical protein